VVTHYAALTEAIVERREGGREREREREREKLAESRRHRMTGSDAVNS